MDRLKSYLIPVVVLLFSLFVFLQFIMQVSLPACSDGTREGGCSFNKPYYCINSSLVKRFDLCGCPRDMIPRGTDCVSIYETGPSVRDLVYVLRGVHKVHSLVVYSGLNDYLSRLPREYECDPECPSREEIERSFTGEATQLRYLADIAERIGNETGSVDDRARIAISIVQQIPYDDESFNTRQMKNRYPYQVLFEGKGVCGEKSRLLAGLLKELGFGTAIFYFESENHAAVGIKCGDEYDYKNTGYCFIETTGPSIVTDDSMEYQTAGKLDSIPQVLKISDGRAFDASDEFRDAREWMILNGKIRANGGTLEEVDYDEWAALAEYYGIRTGT